MRATIDEFVERITAHDPRAMARAMRLIDERDPSFVELLKKLHPLCGRAAVIGITGTAGAGKSTLVDRLVQHRRASGERVGVVAIDPTSPYSGGAVLGDRIRMQQHFLDEGVFIRSLATRGNVGGLSRSAAEVTRVLDAAGFDTIFVETVGVGQDELEVTELAHTVVLVLAPGLGDDIQAIKAGILETADVFVVNKADRDGADATVRDIEQMIALGHEVRRQGPRPLPAQGHSAARPAKRAAGASGAEWTPPVLRAVATRDEGVELVSRACAEHKAFLAATPRGEERRAARARFEFRAILRDAIIARVEGLLDSRIDATLDRVVAHTIDPYSAAEHLIDDAVPPRAP